MRELDMQDASSLGEDSIAAGVPREFQALVAELHHARKNLEIAYADIDRAALANNTARFEELGNRGMDRPSRSDFDVQRLREEQDRVRFLRESEEAYEALRVRVREQIALSEVDSDFLPDHKTPVKGQMNLVFVRNMKHNAQIEDWMSSFSTHSIGDPAVEPTGDAIEPWEWRSVQMDDSASHHEGRYFQYKRGRAFQKLQEGVLKSLPTALIDDTSEEHESAATGSFASKKRSYSMIATDGGRLPVKRQRPPA